MADPAFIGKYRIDSVLGKGAMGVVYKAFDPGIERAVAIKTVRKDLVEPELVEQSMARFKNEARAAGRLLHPNIVSVYEYGEDDANAFIVDGIRRGHRASRDFLNRGASFDLGADRGAIMTQLLLALDFAHERGRRPPRHQAREPDPDRGGHAEGRRFRHRPHRYFEPDDRWAWSWARPRTCRRSNARARWSTAARTCSAPASCSTSSSPARSRSAGALETIAYKICHEDPRPASDGPRLSLSPTIDAVDRDRAGENPESRVSECEGASRAR